MMVKSRHAAPWRLFILSVCLVMFATALAVAGNGAISVAGGTADFTPHGTQPLLAFSLEANANCEGCHGNTNNAVDRRLLPFNSWAGTMMANAGRDPLFWAALDVANADVPGVGDYCLRCHVPGAWLRGHVRKDGFGGTVEGFNGCRLEGDHDDQDFDNTDYDGVGCHFCHRVMPTGTTGQTTRNENANFFVDDSDTCATNGAFGPCRRGPYQYPEPGVGSPPHGWEFSPEHQRSELCGSCHDVTTPILGPTNASALKKLILNDGTLTGIPFPIERTYTEWKQSDYGARIFADGFAATEPAGGTLRRVGETCQSCHMRKSADAGARACVSNAPGSRTDNLPVHEMVGANVWVPGLLKALYGGVAGLNREVEFDRTIALATEMLTTRSANLTVALDPIGPGMQTLNARVRVTNLSGHKLPTSYGEGRRMWVNVVARGADNQLLFESAAYNPATAVLTRDAQARVYEVHHGIWNQALGQCVIHDAQGREQFHFVLNNCIQKDNRIPPLGFRGGNDLETQPIGLTYPETSPGSGKLVNYDDIAYAIPVSAEAVRPITVTVTLRHQVASRDYIEFLRDEAARVNVPSETAMCQTLRPGGIATGPRNQRRADFMFDLWSNNGRSPPVPMRTATATTP